MHLRAAAIAATVMWSLASTAPNLAHADDADTEYLVLAGAAMAIPTYFLGVAWHEGTHALTAKAFGATITEVRLWPGMYKGHFYFGLTRWRGGLTHGETAFALFAPKLTDLVLLGGYVALLGFDALPENDYGALALTVFATGAWVDFSKDVVSWNPTNDLIKAHGLRGRTRECQRWPYRVLHLALSVGTGYVLYRGYTEVFASSDAQTVLVPLGVGRF
jgi:hypothetical protein